jgi:hypothetical protein
VDIRFSQMTSPHANPQNDSAEAKALIQAGIAIIFAWLVAFAVMFIAFSGYLPKGVGAEVFRFSGACVFPYSGFIISESADSILTMSHWILSIVLFTLFGSRLPTRWVFIVALATIPLAAFLGSTALRLIGFPKWVN